MPPTLPSPIRCTIALVLFAVAAAPSGSSAQERPPILDMHMHAYRADQQGPPPMAICAPFESWPDWDPRRPYAETIMAESREPSCANPVWSAESDEELMRETIEVMERRNIVAVLSGTPEMVARWREAAPGRFLPGLVLTPDNPALSPDAVRRLAADGDLAVLGEVITQYGGIAPADPAMEPYWSLAEELDLPVGIHMGPGPPGTTYLATPGYRARLSDPFALEEVLTRHPGLRVYVMHAGFPLLDEMEAMLYAHPQLYVDIAVIAFTEPRERFHRYLRRLVESGFGKRVMWGSDQMVWPGVIEPALAAIEEADYLTEAQKRDILYENAARFLRLSDEERERHRAM